MKLQEIKVTFPRKDNGRSNEYSYSALPSHNLKEGDVVVVDSPHSGLTCVLVERVLEEPIDTSLRQIVDKVDIEGHVKRQEVQKEVYNLKKSLELRRAQIEADRINNILAAEDSAFAKILRKLRKLES